MNKKRLDELSELEKEAVKQFIETQSPALGIESITLTAEDSYVIFSDN